jgi:hypothetical protein
MHDAVDLAAKALAGSPNGALVLSFFLKPNIVLAGDAAGQDLR